MSERKAIFQILLCLALSACVSQLKEAVNIFADQVWYLQRPEVEQTFLGILERRNQTDTPSGRLGLKYALVSDQTHVVYAAGAEQRLEPFVTKAVVVQGKLVDLRSEGFGLEVWMAKIAEK
jgi:hypothetical protein